MKKIVFFIAILGTMTLVSCHNDEPNPQPATPEAQQYSFSKAAVDGATYGFLSYKVVNGVMELNPTATNNTRPYGSYVYKSSGLTQNILEPCEIDTVAYTYDFRNPFRGQALDTAVYKTYCVSPAAPWLSGYIGSSRIRFPRHIAMFASINPFDMTVTGYNVFEVPDTVTLYPIQAKMSINVIQGTSTSFNMTDVKLVNGGVFGFFEPRTRSTEVSYNVNPNIFDRTGNTEALTTFVSTGITPAKDAIVYHLVEEPVFAQKYVSGHDPLPMRLSFKLEMSDNLGVFFDMGVPLGIDMETGKHYKFTIIVKSTFVQLFYCVADWDDGYDANDEVGGPGFSVLLGQWCFEDWEDGYNTGGTDVIGN